MRLMIIVGMTLTDPTSIDGVTPLAHWGLLRADGAEAAQFLHGQLTQDVEHLDAGSARLAGYCSPKGRLLASFVVWRPHPETVFLACSADVLPAVLKRLSMFVLRARCRLADAGADWRLLGVAGRSATTALGDALPRAPWQRVAHGDGSVIRLPDAAGVPRALWVQAAAQPLPALPPLPLARWQWLEVASGVVQIVGATVEQFVPQMVNLELVGGVNFQKGCYPGQEVVARSQYRGTTKRRAQVVSAALALQPGQDLFAASEPEQPAGKVVLAGAPAGVEPAALVELKLAAIGETLHAGSPEGPALRLGSLPYPLPTEPA